MVHTYGNPYHQLDTTTKRQKKCAHRFGMRQVYKGEIEEKLLNQHWLIQRLSLCRFLHCTTSEK